MNFDRMSNSDFGRLIDFGFSMVDVEKKCNECKRSCDSKAWQGGCNWVKEIEDNESEGL